MAGEVYTLEQAEEDIANLRGQVDQLTEILKFTDSTNDWANTGFGAWLYSKLGHLKYASGGGNALNTGTLASFLTADATQCSSTGQTATGLSIPMENGVTYVFMAEVWVTSQSTNDMYISMGSGGGATVSSFFAIVDYGQMNMSLGNLAVTGAEGAEIVAVNEIDKANNLMKSQVTLGTNTGMNTNPLVNGNAYTARIRGFAVCSASGQLQVNQAASANAASFTVKVGSLLLAWPQT